MKLKSIFIIISIFILSICGVNAEQNNGEGIIFYDNNEIGLDIDFEPETVIQAPAFKSLVLNDNEVIYSQVTTRYDSIDPSANLSFPGGRGTNKLVIYTPSYGFHTSTNEFGTEAIIEDNIVTSLSGADSSIPLNGIVISGHGRAKNWINQNVKVGSKVFINKINQTVTVYTTSESYTYEAKSKIDEANAIINYYKSTLKNYDSSIADNYILTAKNYLQLAQNEQANATVLQQYSKEAIDSANMAIKTAMPYIDKELKGIWLRPTEKSEEQIIATLENIKDNGFNAIFLETYFHGKTIFPSQIMNKYGFIVQNENFAGFDPLKIWIDEAHKRGIQVHIWFQSFYVGNQPPEYNPSSILSVHPEWGNKTRQFADVNGATKSVSEHNGYFLDPANPDVQGFLKELVTEIITVYKPDGINLDYIRYPNSNPKNVMSAWGFSEYARNEFRQLYDHDPLELSPSDVAWYDWNEYRRQKVTKFVKEIGLLGREYKTYISAVIFPDIASALSDKQQDWRSWSFNNYIDGFTPLFLTYDSKMLASMMNDVLRVKSPQTDLYAGLFVTFMGGASEDLVRQIYETRKMNANGVVLFDYAHTTPVYTNTLMAGAFNRNSIVNKEIRVAQKKKWWKINFKKNKKTKAEEKQS